MVHSLSRFFIRPVYKFPIQPQELSPSVLPMFFYIPLNCYFLLTGVFLVGTFNNISSGRETEKACHRRTNVKTPFVSLANLEEDKIVAYFYFRNSYAFDVVVVVVGVPFHTSVLYYEPGLVS